MTLTLRSPSTESDSARSFIERSDGSHVLPAEEVSEADEASTDGSTIVADTGSSVAIVLRNSKFLKHQWKSPRRGGHVSWASSADEASDNADQVAAEVAEAL